MKKLTTGFFLLLIVNIQYAKEIVHNNEVYWQNMDRPAPAPRRLDLPSGSNDENMRAFLRDQDRPAPVPQKYPSLIYNSYTSEGTRGYRKVMDRPAPTSASHNSPSGIWQDSSRTYWEAMDKPALYPEFNSSKASYHTFPLK